MESWTRVIVEWINCLGIAEPSVEDVRDLQDCVFYRKLVAELCPENSDASTSTTTTTPAVDERELVSEFIKAEYPEFMGSNECTTGIPDELYIASLLLTQCSQKAAFHRPMCANLKHETQVHIKKFLEMVLPYGKSITREIMGVAIMEIGDATPNDPPSTPVVRPLREFFNSPAARSAQSQRFLNDRNRELRRLKAQLETEQFEKADLLEDIRIQEEKIQNLQTKLQEKSQELRALKNERLKPPTPQSCRKNKRQSDGEERYKRELELLENANLGLQLEIERLQDEREEFARRLDSKDRLHSALKEKFDQCEKNAMALAIQLEMKNNELFSLRLNNEELREHVREIQRSSMGEQSFEMEPISRARSPLLNSSEALSSIVDIQLQEAKEEAAQLRLQLDAVNDRLEAALLDCEEMKRMNANLREKSEALDAISASLRSTEDRLASSLKKAETLGLEKSELIGDLRKFEEALKSNEELLAAAENRRSLLESELSDATSRIQIFEASLAAEKSRTGELELMISRAKEKCGDLEDRLAKTERELSRVDEEKSALEFALQEKLRNLEESESRVMREKSRVNELELMLTEAKKESEDLRILLGTSEESLSLVSADKRRLELELQEKAKEIEESESQLKSEKIRIVELESAAIRAKDEYQQLQDLLRSSEEKFSLLDKDKNVLQSNLEETKNKLKESEARLRDEKSTVENLETTIARLEKESENLRHQLALGEEELANIKMKNKSLEANIEDYKGRLEASENSLINEKALVAKLESTICRLEKNSDDLQNELRLNQESLATQKTRVADLESFLARSEKESENLRRQLALGEEELSNIKINNEALEANLRDNVKKLEASEDSLINEKARAAELEATIARLQKDSDDLRNELRLNEESLATQTSRVADLQSILTQSEKESENLRHQLALSEEELSNTKANNESLESKLKDSETKFQALESALIDEKAQVAKLEATIAGLEKNSDDLRNELRLNQESLATERSRVVDLESILTDAGKESENLRHKLALSEEELSNTKTKNESLESILKDTERRLEASESFLTKEKARAAELESKIACLEKNSDDLWKELRSNQESLATELAKVADLESTVARGEKDFENLQGILDEMRVALEREKSAAAELKEIVTRSKTSCEELESMLRSKEDSLQQSLQREDSLSAELENCRLRISEMESSLRSETLRSAELESEFSKAKESCAGLEVELASKKAILAVTETAKLNVESELCKVNAEVREIEASLADLREKLSNVEEEKREVLLANGKLENRAKEAEETIASLQAKIADFEEKIKDVSEESLKKSQSLTAVRAELTDRNSTIDELSLRLLATEKRESETAAALQNARKKIAELTELGEEVESQLTQEREELAAIRADKKSLNEELASCARTEAELNQELKKISKDLEDSRLSLKTLSVESTEQKIKQEKQLNEVREKLSLAQAEKLSLQEELSSLLSSTTQLENQIAGMKKDLEASNKKKQEQSEVVEALKNKLNEQEELGEKLEAELIDLRTQLADLTSEKNMLQDEASLYGRSNEDLGNKLIALKSEIKDYIEDLRKVREENAELRETEVGLRDEKEELQKKLVQQIQGLAAVEAEKKSLEEKLSAYAKSKADTILEINALRADLEESRANFHQLQEVNDGLKENLREAEATIESLRFYESRSEQLGGDLEAAKEECEKSRERIKELSEELKTRLEEFSSLEKQLEEARSENDLLNVKLNERAQESGDLVASLEKRVASTEESFALAKHEVEMKEEALDVVRAKLERLAEEKAESELRMKEIIVNLQEVRSSQDGVLEAQARALKEKSSQLEEAQKDLVDLRNSLTTKATEIQREKSATREAETKCEKLREQNEVQTNLVKELQITLKIEQSRVEEATKRCGVLEKDAQEIFKASGELKQELNALWDSIGKTCPEILQSRQVADSQGDFKDNKDERPQLTLRSFAEDARAICKAVSTLIEANEKLKSNMSEIVEVSENLKLELNALWDSVRRACPELARPKTKTSIEDSTDNLDTTKISCAVKAFVDDAKTIRKAVSILSEANETLKEHLDGEKETAKSSLQEAERRKLELDDRISRMEKEQESRNQYLVALVERKKNLQELLATAVNGRDEVDEQLGALTARWKIVAEEAQGVLTAGSSACDELKHLQVRRKELDEILSDINERHARSLKPLLKALCRIFVWSEEKLQEAQEFSASVDREISAGDELAEEQRIVEGEILKSKKVQEDLAATNEKIGTFSRLLEAYEANLKSGAIKRAASAEEKLQLQLEKLAKERKEMKEKLDAMRMRNAKMEKNLDDLRNENKKLKSEVGSAPAADTTEVERLQRFSEKLEKEVLRLQRENDELANKKGTDDQDVEARLKEVHNEYGQKLEKIKQKMKTAYNEQIAKLNQEQEKALKEKMGALRVQMEKQCRKYTEDIAKYKVHISDLSSRYWDVGEKLLAETQEKQAALQQLEQLRGSQEKHEASALEANQQISVAQSRLKTASLDRRDFAADRATRDGATRPGYRAVEVIEEETTTYSTRRHSVKSIQAMGNAFNAEDEESELFDSVYLTDLKEGRCAPPAGPDFDRLSELRMRNSMCRPHLKSSYAVETHFQPITLNEDDIKNGVNADDVFNDSLSQSLLPGQKPKKKDRTQTSYKRPGPPTPSKNGGRLSLQGNELKSPNSRVLRERNVERRTTATPRGLKNLFGTSISKRQDENASSTPKRRLSSIFRKQRTTERN